VPSDRPLVRRTQENAAVLHALVGTEQEGSHRSYAWLADVPHHDLQPIRVEELDVVVDDQEERTSSCSAAEVDRAREVEITFDQLHVQGARIRREQFGERWRSEDRARRRDTDDLDGLIRRVLQACDHALEQPGSHRRRNDEAHQWSVARGVIADVLMRTRRHHHT
jgi:hypothetical protein